MFHSSVTHSAAPWGLGQPFRTAEGVSAKVRIRHHRSNRGGFKCTRSRLLKVNQGVPVLLCTNSLRAFGAVVLGFMARSDLSGAGARLTLQHNTHVVRLHQVYNDLRFYMQQASRQALHTSRSQHKSLGR